MQNSILEQENVAEKEADQIECAAQPVRWDSLKNDKFHIQENF